MEFNYKALFPSLCEALCVTQCLVKVEMALLNFLWVLGNFPQDLSIRNFHCFVVIIVLYMLLYYSI